MKRRTFLKSAVAATAVGPILLGDVPARANTSLEFLAQMNADVDDRILIIVQLFGGNDGLNTVIPCLDDEYYKLRPAISIPKDRAWNKIGDVFLNQALSRGKQGGLARMLELGTAAIVQGVGYENPNLSHFRSTDIWLSGINNSDPNVRLDTGWVGRYLEKRYPSFPQSLPDDPLAIQLGGFSLALMSSKGRMGIEVSDPTLQRGLTAQFDTLDAQADGTHYKFEYDFVADIASRSNKYAQNVKNAYTNGKSKLKGTYGSSGIGAQFGAVAALIAGGLRTKAYVVSLGGFDTHVTQQSPVDPLSGQHPALLERFSTAIAEFMYDMTNLGEADRVIGLTVSEFGRRPEENGSYGTDHGASSVQFVFGTQVNSGVFGNAPDLRNLNENRDLVYQIDYRRVYAEILGDWFGLSQTEMREVLQDDAIIPLDVLKAQPGSSVSPRVGGPQVSISNYPNPFASATNIVLDLPESGYVRLDVSSADGAFVTTLVDQVLPAGKRAIRFEPVRSQAYLCTLQANGVRRAHLLTSVR